MILRLALIEDRAVLEDLVYKGIPVVSGWLDVEALFAFHSSFSTFQFEIDPQEGFLFFNEERGRLRDVQREDLNVDPVVFWAHLFGESLDISCHFKI